MKNMNTFPTVNCGSTFLLPHPPTQVVSSPSDKTFNQCVHCSGAFHTFVTVATNASL